MITADTLFMRAEDVVSCDLEGGSALLDLNSSNYFRLNDTANFIWGKLGEAPQSSGQLAASIAMAFDTTADECLPDVLAIMTELKDARLVSPEG
ncbi:MAG: PqqD family protein [Pseudomonadota bacterium]